MKLETHIIMQVNGAATGKLLSMLSNHDKILSLYDNEKIEKFRKKLDNEEELMIYLREFLSLYEYDSKDIERIHEIVSRAANEAIDGFIAVKN